MHSMHSEDYISNVMSKAGIKSRPVRETHQPSISDFVADTPIPSIPSNSAVELRRLLVEFLGRLSSEFERRFDETDVNIWTAMDALNTSAYCFLDPERLRPLFEYCLQIPAVQESIGSKSLSDLSVECRVFRKQIQEELPEDDPIEEVFEILRG